jgi:DHA2 family multidrug resistance protein
MMSWNHLSGWDDVLPAQLARGVAMGLMFVPLSMAALRMLPPQEVPKAAGLYNLFRQLGGSFGIAVLGTLLDYRTRIHGAYIGEHVSALSPWAAERSANLRALFESKGLDPGSAVDAAEKTLSNLIQLQARALAFEDAYRVILIVVVATAPLVLLLKRGQPVAGAPRPPTHAD